MVVVELIVGTLPGSVTVVGASLVCIMIAESLSALVTVLGAPLDRERNSAYEDIKESRKVTKGGLTWMMMMSSIYVELLDLHQDPHQWLRPGIGQQFQLEPR